MSRSHSSRQHGDEDGIRNEWATVLKTSLKEKPAIFHHGDDIDQHLNIVMKYIHFLGLKSPKEAVDTLLTSLSEEVLAEVVMHYEYHESIESISETLRKIHKPEQIRKTEALKKLFSLRQENQSISLFIRRIRIESFKYMKNWERDSREQNMLAILFHGLNNRILAKTVRQLNPETLDQALEMLKYEDISGTKNEQHVSVAQRTNQTDQFNQLIKRIEWLESQMKRLTKSPPVFERQQKYFNSQRREQNLVECFKCHRNGHIARNCPNFTRCNICGKTGHQSNSCYQKQLTLKRLIISQKPNKQMTTSNNIRIQTGSRVFRMNMKITIVTVKKNMTKNQLSQPTRSERNLTKNLRRSVTIAKWILSNG